MAIVKLLLIVVLSSISFACAKDKGSGGSTNQPSTSNDLTPLIAYNLTQECICSKDSPQCTVCIQAHSYAECESKITEAISVLNNSHKVIIRKTECESRGYPDFSQIGNGGQVLATVTFR